MKVLVERGVLVAALGHVHRIVEKRNTIPILSNVLLRARDGALSIKTTDLDLEATESFKADVIMPGATTMPANMLHDIVRKFEDGSQVSLAQEPNGSTMVVRSGRSCFSIQSLPETDFPDLTAGDLPCAFTIPSKVLKGLLDDTMFAISSEETRFMLNGVHVHVNGDNKLRFVATDGHRMARCETDCPVGAERMPSIILPRKTVSEVSKLIDEASEDVRVEVSETKARFTLGGVVLTSKLIDGTYPDYERVIPKSNDKVVRIDRAMLKEAIDRVSTISSERGRAIRFGFSDGRLVLNATSTDAGSAVEETEVEYEYAPMEIGFNSRYVLDIVAHLSTREVELCLADPGSPAILRECAEATRLFVLMPMRI